MLLSDGTITFANAALDARAAPPAESYQFRWFRFDNATGARTPVGDVQTASKPEGRATAGLLASGEYIGVEVTGRHPQHMGWARPATFFFRRSSGWSLVGVERGGMTRQE